MIRAAIIRRLDQSRTLDRIFNALDRMDIRRGAREAARVKREREARRAAR